MDFKDLMGFNVDLSGINGTLINLGTFLMVIPHGVHVVLLGFNCDLSGTFYEI